YALPSDRLHVEVTESLLMTDPGTALGVLGRLHALGVRVSLDDFGTGNASLAYLKRLPLDELKIDQAFVRHMSTDPADAAIAELAVTLGHRLGLRVVAEGVEDQATWELLQRLGCDEVQGDHLSLPLPADDFVRWAAARCG